MVVGVENDVLGDVVMTFFSDQAAQGSIQPGTEPFQQWGILFQGFITLTVKSCIHCIPSKSISFSLKPLPLELSLHTLEKKSLPVCLDNT